MTIDWKCFVWHLFYSFAVHNVWSFINHEGPSRKFFKYCESNTYKLPARTLLCRVLGNLLQGPTRKFWTPNTCNPRAFNYQKCCSKQTDINKKAIFKHQVYVICFLWLLLLHNLAVKHFNPFIIDQDPEQEYFMYLKISCHLKRILHNKIPTLQYMQRRSSVFSVPN